MTTWAETFKRLKAPKGQFRLVLLDRWEIPGEADTNLGVFSSIKDAVDFIPKEQIHLEYLVYNDSGQIVWQGDNK